MQKRNVRLEPHASQKATAPQAQFIVDLKTEGTRLIAEFHFLNQAPTPLKIPALKGDRPERRDKLWETTCFELFLQPQGKKNYWEINVSPKGDWNAYSFTSYREGMKPEGLIAIEGGTDLSIDGNLTICKFNIDLNALGIRHWEVRVGATAVIELEDGNKSYWAIKHVTDKPDFHKADSFTLSFMMGTK